MISKNAYIAMHRFGLGSHASDAARIGTNPQNWLLEQMRHFNPAPAAFQDLPTTSFIAENALGKLKQLRDAKNKKDTDPEEGQKAVKALLKNLVTDLTGEIGARISHAATTDTPFIERLVHFWSNHFTVSTTRKEVIGLVGAYEREAIRPHILGKFSDLVLAVLRHPAMLLYLDNTRSIGPHSPAGKRGKKGLNENLARELLELHTLGVDGGYSQQDVQEMAKMLTGWTINIMKGLHGKDVGAFHFVKLMHEPGAKTLLGKTYPESGENEVLSAVRDLCAHPSTARFLARKMAQHFISDTPPENAVRKLENAYLRSGGDLAAVTKTLITLPDAWKLPASKVKTPHELVIASLRAFGGDIPLKPALITATLKHLGHLPFSAPSPAGWPERAEHWISPEAMIRRIDWCRLVAAKMQRGADIAAMTALLLGEAASPETRFAVARAPSKNDALTLLLASPEFQRR